MPDALHVTSKTWSGFYHNVDISTRRTTTASISLNTSPQARLAWIFLGNSDNAHIFVSCPHAGQGYISLYLGGKQADHVLRKCRPRWRRRRRRFPSTEDMRPRTMSHSSNRSLPLYNQLVVSFFSFPLSLQKALPGQNSHYARHNESPQQ